ncbi:MAG: hypothetical protein K0S04_4497 [Herbinix sp.]|nr:hypothetical protein [Herbinix sp.]
MFPTGNISDELTKNLTFYTFNNVGNVLQSQRKIQCTTSYIAPNRINMK